MPVNYQNVLIGIGDMTEKTLYDLEMLSLRTYETNVFSQFGEDGIIQELLRRIESSVALSRRAIEFGASDGVNCSNTRNLLLHANFHVVYIESDKKLFRQLLENTSGLFVTNIRTFVRSADPYTLENALTRHNLEGIDFDLLSIDIDGNDYWILDSLETLKPKIIVVEFNPTIPIDVSYIQPRDSSVRHGSSALALMQLGNQKGYSAVHATSCNLFLLRDDIVAKIADSLGGINNLPHLIQKPAAPVHCFSAIDGTLLFSKDVFLHWHRIPVKQSKLQILPRYLRKATGDYNSMQKLLFFFRFKLKSRIKRLVKST